MDALGLSGACPSGGLALYEAPPLPPEVESPKGLKVPKSPQSGALGSRGPGPVSGHRGFGDVSSAIPEFQIGFLAFEIQAKSPFIVCIDILSVVRLIKEPLF